MHILIAPNAFKNSLDAATAAEAISKGLMQSKLDCTTSCFPVADGGDGTGKLLGEYLHAERMPVIVQDPLGRSITSSFGWVQKNNTAIIELADASGLRLLKPDEYDPLHATTYGTGELIKEAIKKKASTIIVCIGGSATVDGGTGIMQALGMEFLDAAGKKLTNLPFSLSSLAEINLAGFYQIPSGIKVIVLCDVENRLLGREGAAAVFGPQKGASADDVQVLEKGLSVLHDIVLKTTGKDMAVFKHGGAAGGVAAALHVFLTANLVNGIDHFLEITGFEKELGKANMVITGEGSIDAQTLQGKGPFGVVKKAKQYSLPVIGMAGKINDQEDLLKYFDKLIQITPTQVDLETAIATTYPNLVKAACALGDQLAGNSL